MTARDVAGVAHWLRDPTLQPVWAAARERLERNGVQPCGAITVGPLDRPARHAVSGLLGRPVLRDSVRLDLAALDSALRDRSGVGGLVRVLEALDGPLRNRVAERSSRVALREAPYAALRAWLADHPDVGAQLWVEEWLAGVRRSGVLARVPDAAKRLVRAVDVASRLAVAPKLKPAPEPAPVARTELAARVTGDAHALDEGSVLGQLVLRALAVATATPVPATPVARRALWERHGVAADTVSSTCLVLGLRPSGESDIAQRLRLAAEAGDPVHLTAWDLARAELTVARYTWVLVCENPRVLEAVAQERGGSVTVVCTAGMPGAVTVEMLRRLARGQATLAYHGDFDWPGIAIANRLTAAIGARPWLMDAADYLEAARGDGLPLEGAPVAPDWDRTLGEAMQRRGVAVHEEAVLDTVLPALPG